MSNYVPPPRPPYAQNALAGVENYPDLNLDKMGDDHRAAYSIRCPACLAPALRRCTTGLYKYVPIALPHQGRIDAGHKALAALRAKIQEDPS